MEKCTYDTFEQNRKQTTKRQDEFFHSKNTNHVVSSFSAFSHLKMYDIRTFKPYHRRSLTGMSPSPRVIQRNTRKQRSTMVGDHDPSSSFVTDMEQKLETNKIESTLFSRLAIPIFLGGESTNTALLSLFLSHSFNYRKV